VARLLRAKERRFQARAHGNQGDKLKIEEDGTAALYIYIYVYICKVGRGVVHY
jgi:hypothetical protein